MKLSTFVLAAASAAVASADCPNACSGHGECGKQDQCICYAGYTAGDCSQRTCAFGLSFVDTPAGDLNHDTMIGNTDSASVSYSSVQWASYMQHEYWPKLSGADKDGVFPNSVYRDQTNKKDINPSKLAGGGWAASANEAHFYSECSGKGTCSRDTGVCACYDGYTGSACQRTVCANDCSGHGVCRTVRDIAAGALNKQLVDSAGGVNTYSGVSQPFEYRLWDADKNQACVCDSGYSGVDCSLRECPRGDDPLTNIAATCNGEDCRNELQGFTVSSASDAKNYRISFKTYSGQVYTTQDFTMLIDPDKKVQAANALAIKNALEALPNNATGVVTVTSQIDDATLCGSGHIRVTVEFTTLSGNVPEFTVIRGSKNPGVDAVVQPSEAVQCFTLSGTPSTVKVTVFPVDATGFRSSQFVTYDTVHHNAFAPITTTSAADIKTGLVAAFDDVSALKYVFGTNPVTINVNTITLNSKWAVMAVFKNKNWGTNPIKVELNAAASATTPKSDAHDGNTEHSICSNRGLCDYSTGICACFPGYTGSECSTQSTLAM